MHWVILGNAEQQDELAGKFASTARIDWVSDPELFTQYHADVYVDLAFDNTTRRKHLLDTLKGCVIVNSVAFTTRDIGMKCIRVNGWPGFLNSGVWEVAGKKEYISKELRDDLNITLEWVPDEPGFLSARIIAMMINEAFLTNEQQISTKEDIDIAMKTGTNYPFGPFEWTRKIGAANVVELLQRLSLNDEKYIPAASLKSVEK